MNSDQAETYRRNLSGDYTYQSFVPAPLPPNPLIQYDEPLACQLVNANKQSNLLDGALLQSSQATN